MTNQKKDSFIVYRSFIEAINDLPDKNRLEVYDAISSYSLDEKEQNLTGISKTIFTLIKPQLDANHKKFINGCKGAEYGKLGGRPKTKTPKKPLKNPKETPNVNDNVNVECKLKNENKNKKPKGFIAPTLEEVKNYCKEKNINTDPDKFFKYYDVGDWKDKDGKQVKNWKQKLISWEGRNGGSNSQSDNTNICQTINNLIGNNWIVKIESQEEKAIISISQENWQKMKALDEKIKKQISKKLSDELKTTSIKQKYID